MGITLKWEGKVIDFGEMSESEVQDWISAQQVSEVSPEAGGAIDPVGKQTLATGAARYGLPTATAALTANVPLTMLAAGAGEYVARTIEDRGEESEDPREFARQEFMKALNGAGVAALEGIGLKYLSPALTKGFNWANLQTSKLYRRFLLPDKMSPEMETTLRVLRFLSPEGEGLLAPSLGQLSRHERKAITYFEDVARSSLFTGKRWRKFDGRNLDVVGEEAKKLFRFIEEEFDDEVTGKMIQTLLYGPQGEHAYLRAVSKTMYRQAEDHARKLGITVDMTDLHKFIMRHTQFGPKGGISSQLDEVKAVVSRIDDILIDRGIDPYSAAGWDKIPGDLAIEIRREINQLVNKIPDDAQKVFIRDKMLSPRIRKPLEEAFGADDEAFYMLKKADDLIGTRNARLVEGKLTKAILNELAETPSGIMAYFKGGGVKRIDRLNALEEMFTKTYVEGTGKVTRLGREMLEGKVYPALRHSIISEAVDEQGNLVGSKLVKLLSSKSYGKDGGAFLNKIFSHRGKPYVETLRSFATTLDQVSDASLGGSAIWMKLAQGGALIQTAGMAASAVGMGLGEVYDSRAIKTAAGTAGVIFISPSLLSRKLTDPKFIRMLTDGLAHGPKSRPFARIISTIAALNAEALTEWAKMNPNEKEFYATSKGKSLQAVPDFQPF